MRYTYDGFEYEITPITLEGDKSKVACEIRSSDALIGYMLSEPAATAQTKIAFFDNDAEAISAGVFHIHTDSIRVSAPRRIMRLIRMAATLRPGGKYKLKISDFDLDTFLFSTADDWTDSGWTISDERLGKLNLSREELLDALKIQLSNVDIETVELDSKGIYSRVIPL